MTQKFRGLNGITLQLLRVIQSNQDTRKSCSPFFSLSSATNYRRRSSLMVFSLIDVLYSKHIAGFLTLSTGGGLLAAAVGVRFLVHKFWQCQSTIWWCSRRCTRSRGGVWRRRIFVESCNDAHDQNVYCLRSWDLLSCNGILILRTSVWCWRAGRTLGSPK